MYKNIILPASLLAGTIIGAGVFALPFVFQKAGIITGLFYLSLFGVSFTLIHLMYADLILKTEGGKNLHRFPGYAKIYLGNTGFWISILMTVVGMLFVLTVYLILSVSFINLIKPLGPNISDTSKLLIFWFLGSVAIFLGIRKIAFSEFLITGGIMAIILIIFGYGLGHLNRIISVPALNPQNIFLPYGAVLFALSGRVAIPAVINYFQKIKSGSEVLAGSAKSGIKMLSAEILPPGKQPLTSIKKSIILGTLLPALVYLLFVFGIWGLSETVSEDAISGLVGQIPQVILTLIGVLGLISLWSSYIVIGLDVKSALKLDLKIPEILASLVVVVLPPLFYFLGFKSFLVLASMVGGIFIALEGIFVALMWLKSSKLSAEKILFKKLNPLIVYILILIFIGGIIYELIY